MKRKTITSARGGFVTYEYESGFLVAREGMRTVTTVVITRYWYGGATPRKCVAHVVDQKESEPRK